MADEDPLVLTFDPQTVDHLGAKMYSHLPNALAELIANAYDADATRVLIRIESKSVSITDNGHGMSREDVRDKYLHIGRNRRADESQRTESGRRFVSGKKGLGKLALFGIGRRVELQTTRAGSEEMTTVVLSYQEMMESKGAYLPSEAKSAVDAGKHGTSVRLGQLKRTSAVNAFELARSLSRLFNYSDEDFQVWVEDPDGNRYQVDRESRLDSVNVEFEWRFPEDFGSDDFALAQRGVIGHVVSSETPLRQGMRGITIYVSGRLANEPEFFDAAASSFAYSYLTGYFVIDYLDGLEPDVIATDRRAIDWDTDETALLRDALRDLITRVASDWRTRRALLRRKQAEEELGQTIDEWVESIKTEEGQAVRDLVVAIQSDDVEISEAQQGEILRAVQNIAPPYAEYVWRHFHPSIRDAAKTYYEDGNFYLALQEAIKRFLSDVKLKSGAVPDADSKMLAAAFGENALLRVFAKYAPHFKGDTANDIERSQLQVSQGIIAGFRNPMAHEELKRLHETGAFDYDDCLDALSIISYLARRLDDAEPAGDGT